MGWWRRSDYADRRLLGHIGDDSVRHHFLFSQRLRLALGLCGLPAHDGALADMVSRLPIGNPDLKRLANW